MRRIIWTGVAFAVILETMNNLFSAIVAAAVTYLIVPVTQAPTKMVTVHDFEKGESRIQPMDADTERYLKSRERKGL